MADSERSGRGVLKWILTLIVLGAIGVGIVGFWNADDNVGVTLNTATVDRGVLRQTISATGTLNPLLNVEVGSQVSGIIDEIFVDFNSEVRRGEVLARIETSTFEANVRQAEGEVASARAALELAEVELGRLHQLRDRELVPQSEVDTAVARLRQAEATLDIRQHALERAQTELARCTIYSPVDGMVISRNVDVGQTVAASMTAPVLFRIANDLSRMQINSLVPEADIGNIRDDQRVEFTVDAFPGETFEGVVVQVRNQPIIEQNVVTYDTVIEVDNPDRKLKPGMTALVTIIIDERHDILRVRNTALRARLPDSIRPPDPEPEPGAAGEGDARTVYRLRGSSSDFANLEALTVRAGVTDGVYTEIFSGVSEGDELATGVNLTAPAAGGGGGSSLFGPAPARF
jgi:HlyD family secretion protein